MSRSSATDEPHRESHRESPDESPDDSSDESPDRLPERPFFVVFDCETDCGFRGYGKERDAEMQRMQPTVTCALLIDSEEALREDADVDSLLRDAKRLTFWRDVVPLEGMPHPFAHLLQLFDKADAIVGYNQLGFDLPLLRKFYGPTVVKRGKYLATTADGAASQRAVRHRQKAVDLCATTRDICGDYLKLDELLLLNDLPCKNGNGLEAIKLWEAGRRSELESYCARDVTVTARLALTAWTIVRKAPLLVVENTALRKQLLFAKSRRERLTESERDEERDEESFVFVAPAHESNL